MLNVSFFCTVCQWSYFEFLGGKSLRMYVDSCRFQVPTQNCSPPKGNRFFSHEEVTKWSTPWIISQIVSKLNTEGGAGTGCSIKKRKKNVCMTHSCSLFFVLLRAGLRGRGGRREEGGSWGEAHTGETGHHLSFNLSEVLISSSSSSLTHTSADTPQHSAKVRPQECDHLWKDLILGIKDLLENFA